MRHSGRLLVVVGLGALVGCAHNVPQDRATGPDGRIKGAQPIALENNAGKVRGIVTYPGGDRVDWKIVELPAGTTGTLDLRLSWRTPRPGLQLGLDVFDAYKAPIATTTTGSRKGGRIRSLTIKQAVGTYYVRVYAPKRGDAGQYTLLASYEPAKDDKVDLTKVPVPQPPKLPAVPGPEPVCTTFDPTNRACEAVCPEFGAPKGWPGCRKYEAAEAAAQAAKDAELARQECLKSAPTPIVAQVKHVEGVGGMVKVKLAVGTGSQPKLDTSWTGEVLSGATGTGKPLVGASVRIIGVDKQLTRAEIRLTTDQMAANPWVRLTPPANACR